MDATTFSGVIPTRTGTTVTSNRYSWRGTVEAAQELKDLQSQVFFVLASSTYADRSAQLSSAKPVYLPKAGVGVLDNTTSAIKTSSEVYADTLVVITAASSIILFILGVLHLFGFNMFRDTGDSVIFFLLSLIFFVTACAHRSEVYEKN
jgi:hypothetical protein